MINSLEVEAYLDDHEVEWTLLAPNEFRDACRRWVETFGEMFSPGAKLRQGVRACQELSQVFNNGFFLLSSNEKRFGLHSSNRQEFGYVVAPSSIPDFRPIARIDFLIVDVEFSWTMVYSHEDDIGEGGPHFCHRDWLMTLQAVPPRRASRRVNRRDE